VPFNKFVRNRKDKVMSKMFAEIKRIVDEDISRSWKLFRKVCHGIGAKTDICTWQKLEQN